MPSRIIDQDRAIVSRAAWLAAAICIATPVLALDGPDSVGPASPDIVSDRLVIPADANIDWTAAAVRRGGAVVRGPRGGVAAVGGRAAVRTGPRPGVVAPARRPVVVALGWRRPASYWWRPGGAIAAGAAIGFVTAAAAASYAGAPPASGYCWYYSNPERTQGFWDVCP